MINFNAFCNTFALVREKYPFELILSLDLEDEGHVNGASGPGCRLLQQGEGRPSYPGNLGLAGRAFAE